MTQDEFMAILNHSKAVETVEDFMAPQDLKVIRDSFEHKQTKETR